MRLTVGLDLHNLPIPPTSFVGRAREIDKLAHLVLSARLLTLTGSGGVGKTRLALAVAGGMKGLFRDGIWLADLAGLTHPTQVRDAVTSAFDFLEQGFRGPPAVLAEALASKHLLLILDTCEHLIESCAELATTLLQSCPLLHILATSREALRIPGETVWRVPSLAVPDGQYPLSIQELSENETVQLFVDRARAVAPDFALSEANAQAVSELCCRLDGIPLAIELAAARVHVLSPQHIVDRLSDSFRVLTGAGRSVPERQRTMRGAIEWSYDLLSQRDRTVFHALSVFAGGCALEAAEAVCTTGEVTRDEVAAMLERLVDKSLVLTEQGRDGAVRLRLLEPLRQFAYERLTERGDLTAARHRHAAFFLQLAEDTNLNLGGPDPAARYRRLEREYANLRAAMSWLVDSGEVEGARRLAVSLRWFWYYGGQFSEGRAWINKLLASPGGAELPALRMKLLHSLGMLAYLQHDMEEARRFFTEALALCGEQEAGRYDHVHLLMMLGQALSWGGEKLAAAKYLDDGAAEARVFGDVDLQSFVLFAQANVAVRNGDYRQARAYVEKALAICAGMGMRHHEIRLLALLGRIHWETGNLQAALSVLERSLSMAREDGSWVLKFWPLRPLIPVALEQGDLRRAEELLCEYLKLGRDLGNRVFVAEAFEGCGSLASLVGQDTRALRLIGAATQLRRYLGVARSAREEAKVERLVKAARQRIDNDVGEIALREGMLMPLDRAIAYALQGGSAGAATAASHPTISGSKMSMRLSDLTTRERQVAELLAQGLTNRQIAERLFIGETTVASHVSSCLNKLGLRSRTLLAARAREFGIGVAWSRTLREAVPARAG